jgi:hypothetical protein
MSTRKRKEQETNQVLNGNALANLFLEEAIQFSPLQGKWVSDEAWCQFLVDVRGYTWITRTALNVATRKSLTFQCSEVSRVVTRERRFKSGIMNNKRMTFYFVLTDEKPKEDVMNDQDWVEAYFLVCGVQL